MSNKRIQARLCIASLIGVAFSQPSSGQNQDQPSASSQSGLEEIVVTARRREERLQAVPLAVTAFTGAALEEKGIENVVDLAQNVPSLVNTTVNREQLGGVTIRGLPGVAIYFSEVPTIASGYALNIDMDSVQVLKGPQGTLFGVNTTGGAILFEPKHPTSSFEGYGQVTLGSYNWHKFEGAVNVPIVEDKLLARVTVAEEERDGFTKDLTNDKDYDNLDWWYGRASVTFRPTDNLENYLVTDYYNSHSNGTSTILRAIEPNSLIVSLNKTYFNLNAEAILAEQNNLGVRTSVGTEADMTPIDKVNNYQTIDIARWDITDDLAVRNIAGYYHFEHLIREEAAGSPLYAASYITPRGWSENREDFNEEFQLQGKALDEKLVWTAGGYLQYQHPGGLQTNQVNLFGLQIAEVNGSIQVGNDVGNTWARTQALYSQATYDLSDVLEGLKFTGGFRYTWDYRSVSESVKSSTGGCVTPGDINCFNSANGRFHSPGWTLSLDYKVLPDVLVYARSSKGYTSGGFNLTTPIPGTQAYQPEYLIDQEIGVKADWQLMGMKFRTNLDGYRGDYTDIQRTIGLNYIGPNGKPLTATISTNAASATVEGVEFEGTAIPLDGLELSFGYSYNHSKYDKYDNPVVGNLSGNSFAGFPSIKANLGVSYKLPIPEEIGDITAKVDYSMQNHWYLVDTKDPYSTASGYSLVNIRLDWKNIYGQPIDGSFFMTNALNATYLIGAYDYYPFYGEWSGIYGEPRMWGFQLKYRFGPNT